MFERLKSPPEEILKDNAVKITMDVSAKYFGFCTSTDPDLQIFGSKIKIDVNHSIHEFGKLDNLLDTFLILGYIHLWEQRTNTKIVLRHPQFPFADLYIEQSRNQIIFSIQQNHRFAAS